MAFNIGDQAVYPAHGVGRIQGIEQKEIGGQKQSFFILKILDTGMTIMVPTRNAGAAGLRAVVSHPEAEEIFALLRDRSVRIEPQTWNRRYREYMTRIKTGSLMEVAKVLRDLSLLKGDKPLSFGERGMLDTARSLLVKELSVAMNTAEEVVESELHGIFLDVMPTA